jgi:hypothetical protein
LWLMMGGFEREDAAPAVTAAVAKDIESRLGRFWNCLSDNAAAKRRTATSSDSSSGLVLPHKWPCPSCSRSGRPPPQIFQRSNGIGLGDRSAR